MYFAGENGDAIAADGLIGGAQVELVQIQNLGKSHRPTDFPARLNEENFPVVHQLPQTLFP